MFQRTSRIGPVRRGDVRILSPVGGADFPLACQGMIHRHDERQRQVLQILVFDLGAARLPAVLEDDAQVGLALFNQLNDLLDPHEHPKFQANRRMLPGVIAYRLEQMRRSQIGCCGGGQLRGQVALARGKQRLQRIETVDVRLDDFQEQFTLVRQLDVPTVAAHQRGLQLLLERAGLVATRSAWQAPACGPPR